MLKSSWLLPLFALIATLFFNCNSNTEEIKCTEPQSIQASYNLNLPLYQTLNVPGGYLVLPPDGTNGSRGLILVNSGSAIKAFDRNAPHICPGANTTLEVIDDIRIVCPADDAQWILLTGQPINDATNGRAPYQYFVQMEGQNITITN